MYVWLDDVSKKSDSRKNLLLWIKSIGVDVVQVLLSSFNFILHIMENIDHFQNKSKKKADDPLSFKSFWPQNITLNTIFNLLKKVISF